MHTVCTSSLQPHDNCKIVIMMIINKVGVSTICIVQDDVAAFVADVTRLYSQFYQLRVLGTELRNTTLTL